MQRYVHGWTQATAHVLHVAVCCSVRCSLCCTAFHGRTQASVHTTADLCIGDARTTPHKHICTVWSSEYRHSHRRTCVLVSILLDLFSQKAGWNMHTRMHACKTTCSACDIAHVNVCMHDRNTPKHSISTCINISLIRSMYPAFDRAQHMHM